MDVHVWLPPLVFGCAGVVAGAVARILLARLARGVAVRPGWCEAATAGLWAVTGSRWGALPLWWLAIPLLLGWFGVALTATDLLRRRLPNALTFVGYPVFGAALASAAVWGGHSILVRALLGSTVFGGVHLAVHLCRPRALGAGDVKLAGWTGAVLGVAGWPAMVFTTLVAALSALVLRWTTLTWRDGAPHGPGLLAASWLVTAFPATGIIHPP